MKRSEMIKLIEKALYKSYKDGGYVHNLGDQAKAVLEEIDPLILPPTQECKVIPDEIRGGHKHSPSLRVWDEE